MVKGIKLEGITYQKVLIRIIITSQRKMFYDQPVDSDIKQYREIRKSTTEQGEN